MLNNCTFMGRITRDLIINESRNGTSCLSFDIAVNRPMAKDITDFIHCTAYGKTAEHIAKYFGKGSLIGLTGIMTTQNYTSKQTGQDIQKNVLVIQNASFTGEPTRNGNDNNQNNNGNNGYQNNGNNGYQNNGNNNQKQNNNGYQNNGNNGYQNNGNNNQKQNNNGYQNNGNGGYQNNGNNNQKQNNNGYQNNGNNNYQNNYQDNNQSYPEDFEYDCDELPWM